MTDEPPLLSRTETMGDDSPTVLERLGLTARQHRALTALLAAGALVAAGAVGAQWWRSRPVPPAPQPFAGVVVTVQSTGQGGVVLERTPITEGGVTGVAKVVLELKATLQSGRRAVGRVQGIIGSGVTATEASGMPPIDAGSSSVGLVYATLDCGTALADPLSYRLTLDLELRGPNGPVAGTVEAPLGGVQEEWMALLSKACVTTAAADR